jgi:Uma2 family endonuclease
MGAIRQRMSARAFRAFQAGRPDHERWELIRGIAVMMTPPTIAHNRIAGNLERLLNAALAQHDPARLAVQRPGIELGSTAGDFRPEPDLAVIDADYAAGQRFVERAYLLAEIISPSDDERLPGGNESWRDVKHRLYRTHAPCEAILMIEQDCIAVRADERAAGGCVTRELTGQDAELILAGFGLRCPLAALYHGTPLLRPR